MQWYRQHRGWVRVLSVLVPLLVSAGVQQVAWLVANSAAALVLMLLVVTSASTGDRLAGVLAAVAAAVGFDFFLTVPYFQLRIDNAEDVQLAVLLLIAGVAVSELASWGWREAARANEQAGFIQGALRVAALAAGSNDDDSALARAAESIGAVLGVTEVTFEYGDHDPSAGVVRPDGTLRHQGRTIDVTRDGLPETYAYMAIPVVRKGAQLGYFRIDAPLGDVRPGREQLQVAVLLAGQWALRAETPEPGTRRALHRAASARG